MNVIEKVYNLILDRRKNPKEGSYVNYLQEKGIDKICKKIGEEAAEVIIGAKNNDKNEVIYEVADLWFHNLVLLAEMGVSPDEIYQELEKRYK
jgi:phosphoribosyl-ATP pyrophosphohydrolase